MEPGPRLIPSAMALSALPVLVLDCQSTGANPRRGHLLEVAWTRLPPEDGTGPTVQSHLVALPAGRRLPPRIRALTGIEPGHLQDALPPAEVWCRLVDAAHAGGPAVVHFARFERAFLEALHDVHGDGGPFPLDLLCTHEIVCRLLPDLPRRGLRAVAGFFGHVMNGPKRAAAHVRATAVVWSHLVERLRADAGVDSLEGLRAWLTSVAARRSTGRAYSIARETRLELPEAPGVYRMRARGGEVLYLGKATSLRRRVNGYFQKQRHGAERTPELLTQVFDIDVTVTPTALEAALRETDEIKHRAPPYNLALKSREHDVWFVRADLADAVPSPDATHVVGPLADRGAADALAALRSLLAAPAADPGDARWRRALGLWESTPLDAACVREGFEMFADRHELGRGHGLDARRVRGLGARLWRVHLRRRAERKAERRARREAEAAGDVGPEEAQPARDRTVRDPEQVARRLESTVLHCAHRLRRARWFLALSECVVRWRTGASAQDAAARQLILERGRVVQGADVPWASVLPAPPGAGRTRRARQRAFDAATHDRLRVLTTELRRLVTAGRDVVLRFGPDRRLDRAGLARRLYWV